MFELRGYIDESEKKRFAKWFEALYAIAAARVTIALTQIERGDLSNTRGVGKGVAAAQVCWADYKRRKRHAPYP